MWGRPRSLPIDQGRQRSGQGSRRVRAVHSPGTIPVSRWFTHTHLSTWSPRPSARRAPSQRGAQEPRCCSRPVVRHGEQPGRRRAAVPSGGIPRRGRIRTFGHGGRLDRPNLEVDAGDLLTPPLGDWGKGTPCRYGYARASPRRCCCWPWRGVRSPPRPRGRRPARLRTRAPGTSRRSLAPSRRTATPRSGRPRTRRPPPVARPTRPARREHARRPSACWLPACRRPPYRSPG
jgi:hypothetical protein